jgi:myo-inositol-1(or 4)-monophosphatase
MKSTIDYQKICQHVQNIARETGGFIREERKKISEKDVELKSAASLVTYVDTNSEKRIVKALKELIPSSGFITEENTATNKGDKFNWIIDPLDGTTNYVHGITPYSVSIALMEYQELILGVVYEIGLDEMFFAWKGSPSFLNGKEIKVASASHTEDTLIATGFPYYDFSRMEDYIDAMKYLMKSTRGLRRLGSAAVDLSYVASGRFNAFFEHSLHAWDVAAGVFILRQSGGRVTDFNGGDNWLYGGEIVAAAKNFFDPFYEIIHKHLGNK